MILFFGFALIFARVAAMVFAAPILGNRSVPAYVRFFLSVTITVAISPVVISNSDTTDSLSKIAANDFATSIFGEAITGFAIGLGILIVFSTAMMIGSAIGQISGLQLDSQSGSSSSFGTQPTSQLIGITATAVFVLSGGLELMLSSVMDSFFALPIGQTFEQSQAIEMITGLLQQSFELAVRAVAPAVATLLISTIVVGILSRSLPQLNLIQVGLSSNMALMFFALFFTLAGCVWLVIDDMDRATEFIESSLKAVQLKVGP